ncbi:MAG: transposase [Coriobacteriales bacterium]|jgi:REP element-mobilizing transposase RayT|nr:transposase [Coriobacteriales bacterium]
MTRVARQISASGIYHIVFRGVNHCHLFEEDADYRKFLDLLFATKDAVPFDVYAYCLMGNHVHLLVHEGTPGNVSALMHRVLVQYAGWFNRKYARSGALVANRYKSESVDRDRYLLAVVRYIHQNPVVAGIAKDARAYRWSSYRGYLKGNDALLETSLVLDMFSDDHKKAIAEFRAFHQVFDGAERMPSEGKLRTDAEVLSGIKAALGDTAPVALVGIADKKERDRLLCLLRDKGFSIRQIERATGISRGIIAKCRR